MILVNKIRDYINGDAKSETVVKALQANNEMEAKTSVKLEAVKTKSGKAYKKLTIDAEELPKEVTEELLEMGFTVKKLVYLEEYEEF